MTKTHASTHNVLNNPKEGLLFGMDEVKSSNDPGKTEAISGDARQQIYIRDGAKLLAGIECGPVELASQSELSGDAIPEGEEQHLGHGTGTAEGIHDLDE